VDSGWLAIFGGGGLLGFFLRPTIERLFVRFFRPRLAIEFPGAEPGCEVTTPIQGTQQHVQRYLRIRIRNRGRTTANKVSIYGTVLRHQVPGAHDFEFREEVLDLPLSMSAPTTLEFRLSPEAYRYVDLCYIIKGDPKLHWGFVQKPLRLYNRSFGPGRYRLHVFASSDNSESVAGDVVFSWDGTFTGLQAIGFALCNASCPR
jgi:hypothetical protein